MLMMMAAAASAWNGPWLVLVVSAWVEACSGLTYAFGTYSSAIKSSLLYDQKHLNRLGVAKDVGDNVGLIAGFLCNLLPTWGLMLMGVLFNLVGYGSLWFIVVRDITFLPFWMVCGMMFVGANGSTFFDTGVLISCIHNFPRSRGPVVGILKGFKGLSGAIFTQIYATVFAPDQAAFIFMVAVGPTMVVLAVMFVIRPLNSSCSENADGDAANFRFLYGCCLTLAAYLMGVLLLQELLTLSHATRVILTSGLVILVLLPVVVPMEVCLTGRKHFAFRQESDGLAVSLLDEGNLTGATAPLLQVEEIGCSTNVVDGDQLPTSEIHASHETGTQREHAFLPKHEPCQVLTVEKSEEKFTVLQALTTIDFLLLFFSICCGAGSGITAINNLGQMVQSLGYKNAHVFVSLVSIWNFLGRLAGGQASEVVARRYGFPRPLVLAVAQVAMSVGHLLFAMALPGSLYAGSLLVGMNYGVHWAIFPATVSELFGLRNYGLLIGFLGFAPPLGSMTFSALIAGPVYDWQAEKQRLVNYFLISEDDKDLICKGAVCFRVTYFIMAAISLLGAVFSVIVMLRTRPVYLTMMVTEDEQLQLQKQPHRTPSKAEMLRHKKMDI